MSEVRMEQLREELAKYKLPLRADSQLAVGYAHNTLVPPWSLREVVYELCLIHFLHEYTTYPQITKDILPKMKEEFMRDLPFSNDRNAYYAWEFATEYGIPYCKLLALKNTLVPETWPWMLE